MTGGGSRRSAELHAEVERGIAAQRKNRRAYVRSYHREGWLYARLALASFCRGVGNWRRALALALGASFAKGPARRLIARRAAVIHWRASFVAIGGVWPNLRHSARCHSIALRFQWQCARVRMSQPRLPAEGN